MDSVNNWKTVSLNEVASIQTGKHDANHAKPDGKYRFYTCAYEYQYCNTNRFQGECLILPGNGANVGEVFYYKGEFDAYQRTYVLSDLKVEGKFLYYHLTAFWKRRNQDKQFGSATNYIRMGNFLEYTLPLPPLPTQQAIVVRLEALFSELDKGIEQLKTARQQLRTYRQAVLKAAFEGRLTGEQVAAGVLPEGWRESNLKELALKITDGEHATPKRTDSGVLLLSARNVLNGEINLSKVDYVDEDEYQRIIKRCHPEEGDILISCSGSVGRICLVPPNIKFVMVRSVALVKLDKTKMLPKFYEYLLQSPDLQKQIDKGKKATAQANLFLGPIGNLVVISCKLEQQMNVVSEIESRLSVADKLEETIAQGLQQAEALRQSILRKAFEGDIIN